MTKRGFLSLKFNILKLEWNFSDGWIFYVSNEYEEVGRLTTGVFGALPSGVAWELGQFVQGLGWTMTAPGASKLFWRILGAQVAGLGATWLMTRFQERIPTGDQPRATRDPATVEMARLAYRSFLRRELPQDRKEAAGQIVHYGFGSSSAALFGAWSAVEDLPGARWPAAWRGLLFGSALWLLADEGLVPALGFSDAPSKYPLRVHAGSLGAHWIYGLSLGVLSGALENAREGRFVSLRHRHAELPRQAA